MGALPVVQDIMDIKADLLLKSSQTSLDITNTNIGTIGSLTTTNKSSLVDAINENVSTIADMVHQPALDLVNTQLTNNTTRITDIVIYNLKNEKLVAEPDYTLAMQRIAGAIQDGDTLLVPKGTYNITSEIVFTNIRNFNIDCKGLIQANNCNGIRLYNCWGVNGTIRIQNNVVNWTDVYSGFTLDQSYYCTLTIKEIRNFQRGLVLTSSSATADGTAYNNFKIETLKNNKYHLYINPSNGGFVTENSFFGGRYGNDSATYPSLTGSYGVYMINTSSNYINNMRFYSPCFESLKNGMLLNCYACSIVNPRFEVVDDNHLSGTLFQSTVIGGYSGATILDTTKIHLDSQSRNNMFLGKYGATDVTFTTESSYGGFGFRNYSGDGAMLGYFKHNVTLNTVTYTDSAGLAQTFNKQFEGSVIPITGTYRVNAVVWNTNITSGQPMGWVCKTKGTCGTLSSVTATGTTGLNTMTVNTVAGLYVGANILIGGVFYVVQNINGLIIALTSNLTTTFTNSAVTYSATAWQAMPNYV